MQFACEISGLERGKFLQAIQAKSPCQVSHALQTLAPKTRRRACSSLVHGCRDEVRNLRDQRYANRFHASGAARSTETALRISCSPLEGSQPSITLLFSKTSASDRRQTWYTQPPTQGWSARSPCRKTRIRPIHLSRKVVQGSLYESRLQLHA